MTKGAKKSQKEAEKPTVSDLLKYIKGTDLKAKKIKYDSTGIRFDRVLCYASDTKYGISIWLTKEEKTHQIKTEKQLQAFADKLIKYVEKRKKEMQEEKEKKEKKE